MASATLSFDLPDDIMAHQCAVHGEDFYNALKWIWEYGHDLLTDKETPIDEMSARDVVEEFRNIAIRSMRRVHED